MNKFISILILILFSTPVLAEPMNSNASTYYGSATTTSGGTAIASAKLPGMSGTKNLVVTNLGSANIIIKTGDSTVTVGFPTAADTAIEGTIIAAGMSVSVIKEPQHTNFAVDSESGTIGYSVQYGNGQ